MIEVLEKSLHQLRLAQNEKHLRLQSLEMLEDIAHWKLLHCYGEAMDELYRHQLEKAGFDTKASFILSSEQLRKLAKLKDEGEEEDDDDDDDEFDEEGDSEDEDFLERDENEFEDGVGGSGSNGDTNVGTFLNGFNFEESAGSHQDDENIGTFLDEFEFDGSNDGESDSFFEQDEDNIGTFVDEFIEDNFSDDEFGNSTDSLFFEEEFEDEDFSNEFNDPADGLFLGQRGEEGIFSLGFDENLNSEFEDPTDKLFFNQNENVGSFLNEFDRDDSANDGTLFFEPGEENVGTYLNEYVGDNLRDNQFENPTDSLLLGQENEFYGNEEESYEDIITHALERAELLRIRDEEIEFTEEELEAFKEIAVQMDEEAMLENNPAGDFLAALALFPGVGIANRGFNGRSINTVAETQAFAARISTAKQWSFGGHKSELQWSNRMQSRGWTNKEIVETIRNGKPFPAQNKVNPGNGATRYENPETGKFLVVDDVTNELIQVSRKGDFFPSK